MVKMADKKLKVLMNLIQSEFNHNNYLKDKYESLAKKARLADDRDEYRAEASKFGEKSGSLFGLLVSLDLEFKDSKPFNSAVDKLIENYSKFKEKQDKEML